ncbi:MAG TPA: hypothetical protein VGR70_00285 [Stellaceae bacterium]|nr:hypothetical protein [Stellaceae bacterium]
MALHGAFAQSELRASLATGQQRVEIVIVHIISRHVRAPYGANRQDDVADVGNALA